MERGRGILRLVLLLMLVVVGLPPYVLLIGAAAAFGSRARWRLVMALKPILYGALAWSFGVRIHTIGSRDPRARLFVSNHLCYLDILICSARIGGIFVSREDVRHWPVIGIFARVEGTVFLDRASLRSALRSSREMLERTRDGARLILFPEGGITPGLGVGEFKPLLLRSATLGRVRVQPVTLRYTHVGDVAITDANHELIHWGAEALPTHAWRLLKSRSVRVEVIVHPSIDPPDDGGAGSVRRFGDDLRRRVAEGLERAGGEATLVQNRSLAPRRPPM